MTNMNCGQLKVRFILIQTFCYFLHIIIYVTVADASASWPWDGMTEGGNENIGSHYSCLEMDSFKDAGEDLPFLGQYCLGVYHLSIEANLDDTADSYASHLGSIDYDNRGILKPVFSNLTLSNSLVWVSTKVLIIQTTKIILYTVYKKYLFFVQQSLSGSILGLCVPSSCSKEEIQTILYSGAEATDGPLLSVGIQFSLAHCQIENSKPDLTPGDKVYM